MPTDPPSWETLVFDGIDDMDIVKVTVAFGTVDIVTRGRRTGATCPDCSHYSERVHGFYQRTLRDLPIGEPRVVTLMRVRWSVELAPYQLAAFPVTQTLYAQITGQQPSTAHGAGCPSNASPGGTRPPTGTDSESDSCT
jgi:hypothetical protein